MIQASIKTIEASLQSAMQDRLHAILREQILRSSPTPLHRLNSLIDSISPATPPHRGFTVHPELISMLKQNNHPSARDHLTDSITISGFRLFPQP